MLSIMRLLSTPPKHRVTGDVQFGDRNLLKLSAAEIRSLRGSQVAMIFQDPMTSLNPVLRIEKQMTEAMRLHLGLSLAEAKARAASLLQRVGIPDAEERIRSYPHQFSGGMRQRVMIAMGLACNPKLLIADEPTTALDVTIQAQILELVKQLKQELHMAVIWITHDLSLLAGFADRILVMYAGQVVEQASLHDLYRNPRHPYTIGLLQSIPRLDQQRQRLQPIEGMPPSLIDYPAGCPFRPRCQFAIDACRTIDPPLEAMSDNHQVACWVKPSGQDLLQDPQSKLA